jgi:hypothetical protein
MPLYLKCGARGKMPSIDDNIFDYFETAFYHVTSLETWRGIQKEGLKPGPDGKLFVLFTNAKTVMDETAKRQGLGEYVVVRFSPCYAGIPMPLPDDRAQDRYGCWISLSRTIEPDRLERLG